jgi:predicted DNA-binding transcriptional regulator YafY
MRMTGPTDVLRLATRLASTAEGLTLNEIAREFDVSRRTAERMRDAVQAVFPQMEETVEGSTKRFRIRPRSLDPFLREPSPDEIAELSLAIRQRQDAGMTAEAQRLMRLRDKLQAAMRPETQARLAPDAEALLMAEHFSFQPGPRPRVPPEVFEAARQALLAQSPLRFGYRTPGDAALKPREVVPYGILRGRHVYLVAAPIGSGYPDNPALWRLDRMESLTVGNGHAAPPPDFDLRVFATRAFGVFQEPAQPVVLRFSARIADEAAYWVFHPGQTTERLADGALRVSFTAGGLLEMAWHLVTWGDLVRIEAPDALRDKLREVIDAATRGLSAVPPPGEP